MAAACYAVASGTEEPTAVILVDGAVHYPLGDQAPTGILLGPDAWPQDWDDKRQDHDRIRQLVIAGALIAAEIDRLQREEARKGKEGRR